MKPKGGFNSCHFPVLDMEERRKLERFALRLPANLETWPNTPEKPGISLALHTSNVSSGGAFFLTSTPLPEGTSVKIGLALRSSHLDSARDMGSFVEVTGKVSRSEREGMAVVFDNRYRIIPEALA